MMNKNFSLKEKLEIFKTQGHVEIEIDGSEVGLVFKYMKDFPLVLYCKTLFEGYVEDDVIEYDPELYKVKDIDEAVNIVRDKINEFLDDYGYEWGDEEDDVIIETVDAKDCEAQ